MTQMTDYQRRCALNAIDKLLSYNISKMFSEPVDLEDFPNYLEVVHHPMDLGTIRNKIINNKYANIRDFKQDVQLVWDNSNKYNGKQSLIASLAKTLQHIFQAESEFMTGSDGIDWQNVCKRNAESLAIKLNIVVKSGPVAPTSIASNYLINERRQPSRSSSRLKTNTVHYDAEDFDIEEIHVIEKPVKTEKKKTSKVSTPVKKVQKKEKIIEEPKEPFIPVEELPRFEVKPLTSAEQKELVSDINKVVKSGEEFYEEQILQCIQDMQPDVVKNNQINISIDKLYDSTIIRLRRIVNDIMKYVTL